MRIIICEDEAAQAQALLRMVRRWADARGMDAELSAYASAQALWFDLEGGLRTDAALLDIQMPGMSGLELARAIRGRGDPMQLIFITGAPEHMAEGYDVDALHYLLKPVDEARLFAVLDKAAARASAPQPALTGPGPDGLLRIPAQRIAFVEAMGHTLRVRLSDGADRTLHLSMRDAEAQLPASFVHCHRSYLVSLRCVHQIARTEVELDGGERLPLSRRLSEAFRRAFIDFYRRED